MDEFDKMVEKLASLDEEQFNELMRFVFSARSSEIHDWSTGLEIVHNEGSTTYTIEQ